MRSYVHGVLARTHDLGAGCFLLDISVPDTFPADPSPGQFVMVRGPWDTDPLLPRPFSVLAAAPGRLELLVKAVGRGTRRLVALAPGSRLSVLGLLGNSFPPAEPAQMQVLVGGGVGIPPLLLQAADAKRRGLSDRVTLVYGGRSAEDLVLLRRARALEVPVIPCTEDGSAGRLGRVTDVLPDVISALGDAPVALLGCGPTGMLRALKRFGAERSIPTWISLETEMACGVGVCRGCVVGNPAGEGYRCTCEQGPVFRAEEVAL